VQKITRNGILFQITGKAVLLDEIINYVQSLQRQVEVNSSLSRSPFFLVIAYSKILCWLISFLAVSFNEIGDRESENGFQHGCSFV
jgi:hypothetical protein